MAALMGLLAVALGAFGAHGLKEILARHETAAIWEKAVFYHFIHAVMLFVLAQRQPLPRGPWLSFLIGIVGAVIGTLLGFLVPFVAYMLSAGMELLLRSAPAGWLALCGLGSVLAGTVLAIIAAIYPAVVAARMVPADALRTNV